MCKVKTPTYTPPVVEKAPQRQRGVVNVGTRKAARMFENRSGGAGRATVLTSQEGVVGVQRTADTADREAVSVPGETMDTTTWVAKPKTKRSSTVLG